jgi:hypothetical protein
MHCLQRRGGTGWLRWCGMLQLESGVGATQSNHRAKWHRRASEESTVHPHRMGTPNLGHPKGTPK